MKSILLASLLLLSLVSCVENASPTDSNESYHKLIGSIKGKLIDAITEEPISGAFIKTFPLSSTTKSNEDGTFIIESVGPETYEIIITHSDYIKYKEKIIVSAGITNNIRFELSSLVSMNTKPDKPILVYPSNGSKIGSKSFRFRWDAFDIDEDSLTYRLYFSENGEDFYSLNTNLKVNYLDYEKEFVNDHYYYWYVIASDKYSYSVSDTNMFQYNEKILSDIPDLLGYWKLDGNAKDYGPNSYDGIVQNVDFVEDRNNKAYSSAKFKGSYSVKSKVLLPKTFQLSSQFTIALWVNPEPSLGENGGEGYFECVSKWGGSGAGRASWAFGITKNSNLYISTFNYSSHIKIAHNTYMIPNKWSHIAVTYNSGVANFYVNGEFFYTAVGLYNPKDSDNNASIGGRQDQLSSYHGQIDDVYIFTRALEEHEILKLSRE